MQSSNTKMEVHGFVLKAVDLQCSLKSHKRVKDFLLRALSAMWSMHACACVCVRRDRRYCPVSCCAVLWGGRLQLRQCVCQWGPAVRSVGCPHTPDTLVIYKPFINTLSPPLLPHTISHTLVFHLLNINKLTSPQMTTGGTQIQTFWRKNDDYAKDCQERKRSKKKKKEKMRWFMQ